MKKTLSFLAALVLSSLAFAQVGQRQAVLNDARYLKSIYKTEKAVELLTGLLRENEGDEEVLGEIADCHFQAGDYEAAAADYSMLIVRNPDSIPYKVKLMGITYKLKNYRASVNIGKDITALDSIPAIISLTADAFNQMEMYDSALVWYGKYMKFNPANPGIISKIAKIRLDRKQYDEVLTLADDYLQIDSLNMDIRGIKGLTLYLENEYNKSTDIFQAMEDEGNDSYNVHFYLGQNHWHNNLFKSARAELERAWQIDSSDVNVPYTIASSIINSKQFNSGQSMEEAKLWLNKAIEMISPDPAVLVRLYNEYGRGFLMNDDFKSAAEYFIKSYEIDKSKFSVLSQIGYCYERMKEWKLAKGYYEQYLKVGKPGTPGYNYVRKSLDYVNEKIFMEE